MPPRRHKPKTFLSRVLAEVEPKQVALIIVALWGAGGACYNRDKAIKMESVVADGQTALTGDVSSLRAGLDSLRLEIKMLKRERARYEHRYSAVSTSTASKPDIVQRTWRFVTAPLRFFLGA